MAQYKVSDYIAKRLKEHGVRHFFMVSGGGAMHLNDSLGHEFSYTACHHEQACSFAAEGYAKTHGKIAVVNVTTGPGGLNCLNGVFGQWTDSVPVLYVSGQVKYTTCMESCKDINLRQLGDQEANIASVVSSIVKYAKMVTNPIEIKFHIDKAIHEATSGRMGPVWLDIPMNVQASIINEEDLIEFKNDDTTAYDCKTDEVIEKLKNSKKPLIIAGQGIKLSHQENNLKTLIEKLKIPTVLTLNGMDLLESDNEYYTGRIGTIGQRAGNFALQSADLILCLGTRNNIRQISYNYENFAKNAYKIVVDIDLAELNKPTLKPDLAICADLSCFIPELLEKIENCNIQTQEKWLLHTKKLKEKFSFENWKEKTQTPETIEPYHFTYTLTKMLNEGDVLVSANGTASVCAFQNAIIKKGQRYILNSGSASMGFGLPAAIGAQYEAKSRRVVCLEGDGSIMMNLQELQTVTHNKLPIKIFVINNKGYSSIRQTQKRFFDGNMTGSGESSGVSVPDFVEIGKAFGLETKRISNPQTMEEDIRSALNSKSAILCEVMVEEEYDFAPKLSAKKLEDGTMVSPTLEDMFPFLDREEYEKCKKI